MGFMDKFKHGEESEQEQKHGDAETTAQTSSAQEESHASADKAAEEHEPKRDFLGKLIGGSGHRSRRGSDDDKDDKSFFDKHFSKEDREKKNLELEKRELELNFELDQVLKEQKDNQGFFDKLKDKFDGDVDKEKVLEHPPKEHDDDDKPSFFDKLTGKEEREKKAVELERKEAEIRAELEKVKHDKKENQDLLERIKDKLDGETDDEEERKAREKPSFFDKITGKAEEEERRRREEEEKSSFKKLGDRVNEKLGGGKKAEKEEDFLDKTIDGFQEHVLRKGTQSNESAWEQAKDAQIASAIRSQLHLGDKKDKH